MNESTILHSLDGTKQRRTLQNHPEWLDNNFKRRYTIDYKINTQTFLELIS